MTLEGLHYGEISPPDVSSSIAASRTCRTDRVENTAYNSVHLMRVRNPASSNGRCLQSHYLATGLHATVFSSETPMSSYKATRCSNLTETDLKLNLLPVRSKETSAMKYSLVWFVSNWGS
jgi:hypothetical protein